MIILMFTDFSGIFQTVRQPSQALIDHVVNLFPNAIMKVYDFKTLEIVTFYSENFQWHEIKAEKNTRLLDFISSKELAA